MSNNPIALKCYVTRVRKMRQNDRVYATLNYPGYEDRTLEFTVRPGEFKTGDFINIWLWPKEKRVERRDGAS